MALTPSSTSTVVRTTASLALAALIGDLLATGHARIWGPDPASFAVFTVCALLTEIRPLRWLRRGEGGEVTASWTFIMALV